MVNYVLIAAVAIGSYLLYKTIRGILAKRKEKNTGILDATKQHFKEQTTPSPRVDKKAAEENAPKSLGGTPQFYNEVDHTYGRFLGMFRTDADMGDSRVIHNNCFRIRYLQDVTYFYWFKGSKEVISPCVFRPGIDVISKQPGEEAGVPTEGLVVIKRSMDGQRLLRGDHERYRSMLLAEKSYSQMLADMLLSVQDRQRLAHMDPGSKDYVDTMVEMLQRTKKIQEAAGGRQRDDSFGLNNPYSSELYGAEDTTPPPGTGDDSLWKLG
jgi:hypothetical protein